MSAKIEPEALEYSIDELDQFIDVESQRQSHQENVRYVPSEPMSISRIGTATSDTSSFPKKECMVDDFLPFTIKELIITHRMIQLNQQARTLFVRYFISGEWLNNLFVASFASSWLSSARTKRIVVDGSSSGKYHHRSFLHAVSTSREVSALNKLLDLFPRAKLRPVMMATALRRYFQSPCFLSMVECQWSQDIDTVCFNSHEVSAVVSCLPSWIHHSSHHHHHHHHHPLQRLLAAQLPLLKRPEELQDRLAEDKWIWSLQTVIDNCPLGVGVYSLSTTPNNKTSSKDNNNLNNNNHSHRSSSNNQKGSSLTTHSHSSSKVLTGRYFNRSFATTIGQKPQDLYQATLDYGAMEPFPAETMTNIMTVLSSGEGLQVIAAFNIINKNGSSVKHDDSGSTGTSNNRGGNSCLVCLSLQPIMDPRHHRLAKAVCVPRIIPFCGPSDCAQDLFIAEHLAPLLAAAV